MSRTVEVRIPGPGLSYLYAELTQEQMMAPENFPDTMIMVACDHGGEVKIHEMDLEVFMVCFTTQNGEVL